MRILAYCAMPNHWHLLVWPRESSHLRRFVQRLTIRHAHAWHLSNGSVGRGHLYQGRYKSFPVEDDRYLLTVSRYIERNPVRALLVNDAETWQWSSACWRASDGSVLSAGGTAGTQRPPIKLEPLPVETPRDWLRWVNEPQTDAELYRLRLHIRSGAALSAPDSEPDRQHARPMKTDPVRALEKRPRSRVEVVQ